MQTTASEICELLNGTLQGNGKTIIHRLAKIEEADSESISFIANPKYLAHLQTTQAGALVVASSLETNGKHTPTLIRVEDPYSAFQKLLAFFDNTEKESYGIHNLAFVDSAADVHPTAAIGAFSVISVNAKIGPNVQVYPNVFIGKGAQIGENTILFAGARIYAGTIIGENCIVHSGTVVGSDGFGFAPQADGTFKKVPQTGIVVIGNDVEIGANCTIDRATMGSTSIKNGVKIDNLVHIAHNVEIDENTVIAAQTGISGSTKLGKNCLIGGQVGFVGHLYIAPGTQINAQSGIAKSIKEPNKKWNGSPAFDYNDSMRSLVVLRQLPEMQKDLIALKKQLDALIASNKNV